MQLRSVLSLLRRPAAYLAMLAMLAAPALINGFPFIWADTGGYLARPFERTLELGRSALYGVFLALGIPLDFWPAVVIQAAATAWVLLLAFRTHGFPSPPWGAALACAGLALLTSLPWFVSTLMPDIFLPIAILALHLLAFRAAELRLRERLGLIALIAFAIATHMGTLGVLAGLACALVLLRLLAGHFGLMRPALRSVLISIACGVLLALVSNFAIAGRFAFTPGGTQFVFGRLVQDGIVARYLAQRCPDPTLRLCERRAELPVTADDWLWGNGVTVWTFGGPDAFAPEARRIVVDTLKLYPLRHIALAAAAFAEQFVTLRTGEGLNTHDTHHALSMLERYAPEVLPRLMRAGQQHDAFDFTALNAVHVPLALLCTGLLPILVLAGAGNRIPREGAALCLTVLLALVINAAISGILSNPNNRYQSRVAWLAPLAILIAWTSAQTRNRRRNVNIVERSRAAGREALP